MRKKVLFVYPNVPGSTLIPLNIPILSTVLKQNGFEVELFDTTFYDTGLDNFEKKKEQLLQVKPFSLSRQLMPIEQMYKDLISFVEYYQPNIVAFTVVEDTLSLCIKLIEHLNGLSERIPIVLGGVGATFCTDIIDKYLSGKVDAVVRGEAESIIVWLFNKLICNKQSKPKQLQYIWNRKVLDDIDILPDYSIFTHDRITRVMHGKSHRMLQIEIDRGCPFNCSYCNAPAIRKFHYAGKYYRQKSIDRLLFEFRQLKLLYKPTYFDFNSETFLLRHSSELKEFMKRYRKEINVPFWCQTRPETLSDKKLQILKEGGIADIQFGIEHGNELFRKQVLNRKGNNKLIKKNLELVEKYKIHYTVNMIIGFANETRELIWDSIELLKGFNPKTINVYLATIYRGTQLYKLYTQLKWLSEDNSTDQLLGGNKGLKYLYLTREEIKGLQRCFPLYVRLPKSFYSNIYMAEQFTEEGNRMYAELREIFIREFY